MALVGRAQATCSDNSGRPVGMAPVANHLFERDRPRRNDDFGVVTGRRLCLSSGRLQKRDAGPTRT
jgi:hypothetical protein